MKTYFFYKTVDVAFFPLHISEILRQKQNGEIIMVTFLLSKLLSYYLFSSKINLKFAFLI